MCDASASNFLRVGLRVSIPERVWGVCDAARSPRDSSHKFAFQSLRGFGGCVMRYLQILGRLIVFNVSIPERVWGVCDALSVIVVQRRR